MEPKNIYEKLNELEASLEKEEEEEQEIDFDTILAQQIESSLNENKPLNNAQLNEIINQLGQKLGNVFIFESIAPLTKKDFQSYVKIQTAYYNSSDKPMDKLTILY